MIDPKNACWSGLVAIAMVGTFTTPAYASSADSDRDGMPNTWERAHKLNPYNAADAKADPDRDRLTNLREFRLRSVPRDEDSDNDGQDDGDELGTRTKLRDADSDDDGRRDGDEDHDHDGIANEDEDDASEICAYDDDDRDRDHVDDEDENELRLKVNDADADDDGIRDGAEDRDHDGVQNEDEDDDDLDKCSGDRDRDGEDDEDEADRYGTITSYDDATASLVVRAFNGVTVSLVLGAETELEWEERDGLDCESIGEDSDAAEEATAADLTPGQVVTELEIEDGQLEVIELLRTTCP